MGARGSDAVTTTDHDTIRKWAESRGGRPAAVQGTAGGNEESSDGGILRIDFGEPEPGLEAIDWDRFFRTFEDRGLAFLYQDEIEDKKSRFFKLVRRPGT